MKKKGALIDHAHHESNAKRALGEFVIFDEAIGEALKLTNEKDTLIIATGIYFNTLILYKSINNYIIVQ